MIHQNAGSSRACRHAGELLLVIPRSGNPPADRRTVGARRGLRHGALGSSHREQLLGSRPRTRTGRRRMRRLRAECRALPTARRLPAGLGADHAVTARRNLGHSARLRVDRAHCRRAGDRNAGPGHETPFGFNALEAHVSYVSRSMLARRGYRIYGAGFGRYNSALALRAKRWPIRRSLTSVPYRLLSIAETIVAVKDVTPD